MTTGGQDKDSACAYLRYKMTYLKWATYSSAAKTAVYRTKNMLPS